MVSAFINETDGFLELTDGQLQKCNEQRQKAGKVPLPNGASNSMRRIVISIAHDGYRNGDNQLCQTDEIIDMFQAKYPTKKAIFVFDNSAGHMKKPVDAIRIDKMAKGWGGVGGICVQRRYWMTVAYSRRENHNPWFSSRTSILIPKRDQ